MNLEEFKALREKYGMTIGGVIQVGAHHGQEDMIWIQSGITKRVYFEPIEANYDKLTATVKGNAAASRFRPALCFKCALGNTNGRADMVTETINGGQSCSLLEPVQHLNLRPDIVFDGKENVMVRRLDDVILMEGWLADFFDGSNFLFMDAQGYELQILLGAKWTLRRIDYIWTEVNRAEVFKDCAQVAQIDGVLALAGFRRVETIWHGTLWGDALYIR